jgi:hypothetical protein
VPTEDQVVKFYEWRQTQTLALAAACFSLAGLILAPLLGAMFDPKATVRLWHVLVLFPSSFVAAVAGVMWQFEARAIQYGFLDAPLTGNPGAPTSRSTSIRWRHDY